MDLLGRYAEEQARRGPHHQPLDVVRVAMPQRLGNASRRQAISVSPLQYQARSHGVEGIALQVGRHLVNRSPHILAPAEDLPMKPPRSIAGRAGTIRRFGAVLLARAQELEIERRRQVGMVEPGAPLARSRNLVA